MSDHRKKTVDELKAYAAENEIDLGDAAKKADIVAAIEAAEGTDAGAGDAPAVTRLDSHIDAPSTVAPGDAPHDTTDPTEQASTVVPDFAAAAQAGHGTVNSAVPLPKRSRRSAGESKHRIEQYPATRPDGTQVTVEHNIDTGETKVIG